MAKYCGPGLVVTRAGGYVFTICQKLTALKVSELLTAHSTNKDPLIRAGCVSTSTYLNVQKSFSGSIRHRRHLQKYSTFLGTAPGAPFVFWQNKKLLIWATQKSTSWFCAKTNYWGALNRVKKYSWKLFANQSNHGKMMFCIHGPTNVIFCTFLMRKFSDLWRHSGCNQKALRGQVKYTASNQDRNKVCK